MYDTLTLRFVTAYLKGLRYGTELTPYAVGWNMAIENTMKHIEELQRKETEDYRDDKERLAMETPDD